MNQSDYFQTLDRSQSRGTDRLAAILRTATVALEQHPDLKEKLKSVELTWVGDGNERQPNIRIEFANGEVKNHVPD